MSLISGQVASMEDHPHKASGSTEAGHNLGDVSPEAYTPAHISDPFSEINTPALVPVGARVPWFMLG